MNEGIWWERRREDELTHTYLARVLSDLGAHTLALNAEQCHYDDFLCPDGIDDGLNISRLCNALSEWSSAYNGADSSVHVRAMAVRHHAMRGEFDSTYQEARAWSHSPEGRGTIRSLFEPE